MGRKRDGKGRRRQRLEHDEPFRTCVACRASLPSAEMLRFARAPDGAVCFDVRARAFGRGAWTCAAAPCVRKAVEKGGFERAFEAPVLADADALCATVRSTLERETLAALGVLRKAGALAAGRDDVVRAVGEGTVASIVLAHDLSPRSRDELAERAPHALFLAGPRMADIGSAIGREPTGVVAVPKGPRGERLVEDLKRLAALTRLAQDGPRA